MRFLTVSDEDIKQGVVTDRYFIWTEKVLEAKKVNPEVVAEVTTSDWGIFAGLNDVLKLFEGLPVDVYAMPEGAMFFPHEPVITIVGKYLSFARYETSLLGFICHASAVATEAFKFKLAAGDKKVFSFGTRRMHPALAAMIERAAYIGGVDGVSNFAAEKYLGIPSMGTMPHAMIICFGDQVKAWRCFDEVVDKGVPRTMLVDTYFDEKTEAILAVENVERVDAVRLDTPSSRRGKFRKIVEEVRWELDIRGRKDVKIFVSGGLSLRDVIELRDLVDAFGVGTSISMCPSVDIAMDIIEVEIDGEWKPISKRGKMPGAKQYYRCANHPWIHSVRPWKSSAPLCDLCNNPMESMLKKYVEDGKIIVERLPDIVEVRNYVLSQIFKLPEPI